MSKESLSDQATQITTILPRLLRRLSVPYSEDPAMDLPLAQMRVCSLLYDGSQTMSALSRELGISLSAMTQIADRLERSHLVERVSEEGDRRVKLLCLTDQGREIMRLKREKRKRRVSKVLRRLDTESRRAVLDALQMLLDAAYKDPADAKGRMPAEKGLIL